MISIIIPVLNEEKTISHLLKKINELEGEKEIIVVDGGSSDRTKELSNFQAMVIDSPKGRAVQMNRGAERAIGDVIWFLHSDSKVDEKSLGAINKVIDNGYIGGGFSVCFYDCRRIFMKFVAKSSNLRGKYGRVFFGDQGIFIRRDRFKEMGGFKEIEIMEDLEFSLRAKRTGGMKLLNLPIGTSARRFQQGGMLRTFLLMQKLKLLYMLGVSPEKLSEMYREVR